MNSVFNTTERLVERNHSVPQNVQVPMTSLVSLNTIPTKHNRTKGPVTSLRKNILSKAVGFQVDCGHPIEGQLVSARVFEWHYDLHQKAVDHSFLMHSFSSNFDKNSNFPKFLNSILGFHFSSSTGATLESQPHNNNTIFIKI